MSLTLEVVLGLCLLLVSLGLVWMLLAVKRTVERVERLLGILEPEVQRLVGEMSGLTGELRGLTREATHDLNELRVVTARVGAMLDTVSGFALMAAELTRVGRLVSLVFGVKRGVDAFVHRLRQ